MDEENERVLGELLAVHERLEKELGRISLDRLAQLSSAVVVASALHRVAAALEKR